MLTRQVPGTKELRVCSSAFSVHHKPKLEATEQLWFSEPLGFGAGHRAPRFGISPGEVKSALPPTPCPSPRITQHRPVVRGRRLGAREQLDAEGQTAGWETAESCRQGHSHACAHLCCRAGELCHAHGTHTRACLRLTAGTDTLPQGDSGHSGRGACSLWMLTSAAHTQPTSSDSGAP